MIPLQPVDGPAPFAVLDAGERLRHHSPGSVFVEVADPQLRGCIFGL